MNNPTTAIQVVPVIECGTDDTPHDHYFVAQLDGPDEKTTGWAVYLRKRSGIAEHLADAADEDKAMLIGEAVAAALGVPVEPQAWRRPKPEPFKVNLIVSVLVVPAIYYHGSITAQFDGPTEDTTHWAIYERDTEGVAHWFADVAEETPAMMVGEMIAEFHGVPIEPQAWVKNEDR